MTFVARSVKGKDATVFTEATRCDFSLNPDGHPEFRIKPFGQFEEHLVIRHLYPFVPATFGYDLYDPGQAYRSYAEAAITRGEAVATPPIVLAKDRTVGAKPDTVSVVVRLPVYRRGTNPQSEEERKAAAWGLVGVGFRILDLVGNILSAEMLEGVDLRIVDIQALTAGGTSLIFDTSWMKLSPTEVSKRSATPDTRQPTLSLRVPVGDRQWEIQAFEPRGLDSAWLSNIPLLILACSVVISLLFAALIDALVQSSRKVEAKVREATTELASREERYRTFTDISSDW
ncbi:MAG: CHASE domain-containing protein [Candidatus Protistobacter heckmanni]|nr:CHASE domain-containing protein [Candidatus Protistobacter heckmanni]